MTIDSVSTFLDALRYERLFDDEQLQQLSEDVLAGFDDADSLARHLVQAGWLTAYQVRHLFEGHATRLILGPYCIVDRLGEGGVSEVYKAWDGRKQCHVALKVMRQDLTSEEDAVRQFERERRAVT